ncbi:MAG: response regulator [Clostridiales bacterium]|nr:response regulator [Clostridiales bacterium]
MRLFVTFISLTISLSIFPEHYDFSHIDSSKGLSNNQIEYIFKDSRGFMWFASHMGLNRYDGINFKVYKHIKDDPSSSPYDKYTQIQEDYDNRLWLQYANGGYVIYDLKTETFVQDIDSILMKLDLPIKPDFVEIDHNKDIYCYYHDKNDIYKYESEKQTIKIFTIANDEEHKDNEIINLKISKDFIWLLYQEGTVERLNKKTKAMDFRDTFFQKNGGNPTLQRSLFIDKEQQVWLYPAISDSGVAYYDSKESSWNTLKNYGNEKLSSNFVRAMIQDKKGLIWIATDHGGINILNKDTKEITILKNEISDTRSIRQNSIISLFCDNEGIVWVGTYKYGVSFYHPNIYKFKKNRVTSYFNKGPQIFDCNRLYIDSQDNLWIGTDGQGLIRYNKNKDEIKIFRKNPNDKNSISSNIITALFEDQNNKLWIGTFLGGLNKYENNQFSHYSVKENDSNALSSKSVYDLAEDSDNNLWIGTLGGGLDKLDIDRKTFTHYNQDNHTEIHSNYISSIFTDKDKNIYFCSDLGINVIDGITKEISSLFNDNLKRDLLTSISFNQFFIDSRGLYWLATDKGLNIYNPIDHSLIFIHEKEGLPSDEVVSLIEDNNRNMWVGTRGGLAHIYCQFINNKLDYYITNFDEMDGLPSNICNLNAIHKDKEGMIYVGFTRGYVSFNPSNINPNKKIPQPKFTDLLISNQTIKPNTKYGKKVILDKTISELDEIILDYNQTNITIKFSALSFQNPLKNHYKYKLIGLDDNWTEIKNGIGVASYSNLNSGKYKLIVYASNGDNVWSEKPLEMMITVRPPFWLSWWAILTYVILMFLLIWFFIQWKLNEQKREFKHAQKMLEVQKAHEVDELKIRFFTNISHEFKTPLTLIMTPIEKLIKETQSQEHKTILSIAYRNTQKLLKMVNDILDFRRLDLNKMTLNLRNGDIIPFIRNICQSFSSLAADKSINLTFTSFINTLPMDFDAEKIEKIISNLLSNSLKYTESGNIDVSIGICETLPSNKKDLSIKVSDTGIGIAKEHLEKIFERFYRIESPHKNMPQGTGIGLHLVSEYVKLHNGKISIESTEGKGTSITILIPISNANNFALEHNEVIEEVMDATQTESTLINKDYNKSTLNKHLPMLLIVDDNEDFCSFIEHLFHKDYHVITAHDGQEGYAIVLDQLPDIILCDVMMPVMDGYAFCRKVKADIRTSHIPILLLTAKSSEENQYLGIEAGADDYISKPFNIDILKLKIEKIIERQKVLQNRFKKQIDISPSPIEIKTMDEKFVEKAISIVEENIGDPEFLVEDLCKDMGMSRVYFYKKILALTNKTPSEFIRLIRLKRAADLLKKSQMFVNEIAFQVGFNDPKYFRKYFKEEFGITPSEYKKTHQKV